MFIVQYAILIGLTAAGSAAPLLTFAHLWQVKEWRLDRLREHLRAEGFFRQLFGIVRPAAALPFLLLVLSTRIDSQALTIILLGVFAAIAGIQMALRKQPKPVWTAKARVLVAATALLTIGIASLATIRGNPAVLPAVVLLQPAVLMLAWALFLPVDSILKRRIFRRATLMRASLRDVIVIGITGSAGKTTTKELLAHVLEQRSPLTTPAHVNTEMGVAQWLIQELKKVEQQEAPSVLIVEMGAYQMGEIALLCSIVQPTMGVVTYVGSQHIALFGSQEALCKAKGELVEALPITGHAFLNADNERCSSLAARARCPVTTVGTGGRADIEAFEVEETERGIRFRVKETAYDIPIHGTHNVTNVLLAIAVAQSLGMAPQEIARRLQSFKPPAHTFDMRTEDGITILDDTHNASPASFEAAMQWARAQPAEQRVLLTSGLIELGEEQDRIHMELGTMAASVFDRVIFLSGQSAKPFRRGFGREVELLSNRTPPVPPSSLLVCIGRMSEETVRRLLPPNS